MDSNESPALQRLKEAHNQGVVVGLKDVAKVASRRDIDKLLWDKPDTFNLFLLALARIQGTEMTKNKMGYFEIAGIHGMPLRLWDNLGKKKNIDDPTNEDSGYCHHSKTTFPTWHRPYLAMMEQSIYLAMLAIADEYTEEYKAQYMKAAQEFRLPYWDYYRPRGGRVKFPGIIDNGMTAFPYDYSCPEVFTTKELMVRMPPNNTPKSIKNPLFSYKFDKDIMGDDWEKIGLNAQEFSRDNTERYPNFNNKWGKDGTQVLNVVLNALRMDSNRLMLTMLATGQGYDAWKDFSNNRWAHSPPAGATPAGQKIWKASGSLEMLHNLYHGLIGGPGLAGAFRAPGGHMSRVATAAFDPIFWMHHCQIDRICAIWQAIHPDKDEKWWDSDEAQLDLMPFRQQAGDKTMWNSNGSKTTDTFGYTYAEVKGDSTTTKKAILEMYGWSVPQVNDEHPSKPPPEDMVWVDVKKSQFWTDRGKVVEDSASRVLSKTISLAEQPVLQKRVEALKASEPVPILRGPSGTGYTREWYIDDEVERLALNGAFTIFYFIGDDPDGTAPPTYADYLTTPSLAGINHVFAAPVELCDNCGRQEEQAHVVSSAIAITSMLLDFMEIGALPDLEPANVVPFLQKRLKWRIMTVNGEPKDPRNLAREKGYEVSVSCKKAALPRGSEDVSFERYPEVFEHIIRDASNVAGHL